MTNKTALNIIDKITAQFVKICANTLKEQGFTKRKDNFYKKFDNGVTLSVWLHRSFFDNHYYIEFAYSFSGLNMHLPHPEYYETDVRCGKLRFNFSRAMTEIHYFEIAPDDFIPVFCEKIENIMAVAQGGKDEIIKKFVDIAPCSKAILNGERVVDFLGVRGCKNIRVV